ncbi:hypothetical protein HUW51_14665 [Adhaeribacter swui]|uniref:Uncharacterized protein n=1 Tax=Adhaeribacter swui TaxID=2086471 RepID=A0A7G7G9S0_9BACT|nr:hypothetical protein [Adhaeribacter swui]QNF33904.1 hypothetical protein HUW51_14665 [Adhaeribacter swui]
MKRLNYLKLELYGLFREAHKIFSRVYEEITMFIFYDAQERYSLVIADNNENIIFEREITRAEAFRIINTRP